MSFLPGWFVVYDLDFTAQSAQIFTSDTNFTIAGVTWTTTNSANDNAITISSATGNGVSPMVITTASNHPLASGDQVVITGATGNTALNGTFTSTSVTSNTITIPGTGNGTYTGSSGTAHFHTQLVNGTGLKFYPSSTSDINGATDTFPQIHATFNNLIGAWFNTASTVRVSFYNPANNAAANFDDAVMGIAATTPHSYGLLIERGFTNLNAAGIGGFWDINGTNAASFQSFSVALGSSNNVVVLEAPAFGAGTGATVHFGQYSSGWPADTGLSMESSVTASSPIQGLAVTQLGPTMGGKRAASGTTTYSTTFARIKIEVKI